jgi:hypothetical protein
MPPSPKQKTKRARRDIKSMPISAPVLPKRFLTINYAQALEQNRRIREIAAIGGQTGVAEGS